MKSLTYEELTKVHKDLDGQCQKCSQRCDKKVVSFDTGENDSLLMVCPDCKEGKNRPFFTPSNSFIDLVSKKCKWKKEETNQFLQVFPLGIAIVNHTENSRKYWNWDKTKFIRIIETDHEGNYINIAFYPAGKIQKLNINGEVYIIKEKLSVPLKNMYVPDEIKEATSLDEKIAYRIKQFEVHGAFIKKIIVEHENISKSKPFTIIDKYSIYQAAKKLGITSVPTFVVEKE